MESIIRDLLAIKMNVGAARRAASDYDLSALLLHLAAVLFLCGQLVDRFDKVMHEWERGREELTNYAEGRNKHQE